MPLLPSNDPESMIWSPGLVDASVSLFSSSPRGMYPDGRWWRHPGTDGRLGIRCSPSPGPSSCLVLREHQPSNTFLHTKSDLKSRAACVPQLAWTPVGSVGFHFFRPLARLVSTTLRNCIEFRIFRLERLDSQYRQRHRYQTLLKMFMKTLVLGGLATIACAHMKMSNPVPYGKSSLENGPLDSSGSDFPCKMREGVYDLQGASNVYGQGSTQQLAFIGSAVHGGGSCQISVTTDLQPTKNSVWKVIKSIEGGCPAKGQTGNMEGGAGVADPYKYDFTIPEKLATGNYTLAWTWFNKVGNREMYMNCAPLTVTGSGGSSGFMSTLPDMFVANVGNGCETEATTDVQFPNPGQDLDQFGVPSALKIPAGAGCQKATGANGGGSYPAGGQPSSTAAPAPASQTSQPPTPTSKPTKSTKAPPGGVFITVSSKQPAASTSAALSPAPSPGNGGSNTSKQPAASTSAAPSPAPSPGNGGGNTPSGGFAPGTPCTSEGSWNCIGGTSFQRCASGGWSAVLGMAAGVTCTPGQSNDFKMNALHAKRAMRRGLRFAA
ncbi:Uncharacterized protein TPAR_03766 [Tolypocladium paradoxum]|uniref:Chitin-binding type-4 domain-containing protein n=1 Tax=Tolypocladium paradoxum TaxID=94208 RepID=A0A2S4L0R2_9HYPO|nr:Uncharacterized protein TPAR_03766 [Tolypocladium paradoxum]